MRIGILTSGGDCPGLNAVIRGAVLDGQVTGDAEFVGFRRGWSGVASGDVVPLARNDVRGLSKQGGTVLGSSRIPDDAGAPARVRRATDVLDRFAIDAIIAIGGESTLSAVERLANAGLPVVGVPKTIENEIAGTDHSFGFDTAVGIATEAIDRLRTTGESHGRCMVVEVMGRQVGWIALHAGLGAGAHAIALPEFPATVDDLAGWVTSARRRGRAPIVVLSEGYRPRDAADPDLVASGAIGGVAERLAPVLERLTGIESRATTLGHLQRGGVPSAYDRVLATRLGMAATRAALAERWGAMVALDGTEIVSRPITTETLAPKYVPESRYAEARTLFG